jgi:hypothetical protein
MEVAKKIDAYKSIVEKNLRFMMSFLELGEYLTRPVKKVFPREIEERFLGLLLADSIEMDIRYVTNIVNETLKGCKETGKITLQSKRDIDKMEKNFYLRVIGRGKNFHQMPKADEINSYFVSDKRTIELCQFMYKMYKFGIINKCKSRQEKNQFEVVFMNQKGLEPMKLTRSKLFDFLSSNNADDFRVNIIDNIPENKLESKKIEWQNEEGETCDFTDDEIISIVRGESLPIKDEIKTPTPPSMIENNPARDLTIEEVENNLGNFKKKFFEELIAGSKQMLEKLK